MTRRLRPCLECGRLAEGPRCDEHKLRVSYAERQYRRAAVDKHRELYGDVCPGWKREGHPATDLTADHLIPRSLGGAPLGPLRVLCRSCNARRRTNPA